MDIIYTKDEKLIYSRFIRDKYVDDKHLIFRYFPRYSFLYYDDMIIYLPKYDSRYLSKKRSMISINLFYLGICVEKLVFCHFPKVDSELARYLDPGHVCYKEGSVKTMNYVKDTWIIVPRWDFIDNMFFPSSKSENRISDYVTQTIQDVENVGVSMYIEIICDKEIGYTKSPCITGKYLIPTVGN